MPTSRKTFFQVVFLGCAGWLFLLQVHAADLTGITDITVGGMHSCALTKGGALQCWGGNGGSLGNAGGTDALTPAGRKGLASGVAAIAAGFSHTCALTKVGAVQCWGRNSGGQLGNGTLKDRLAPQTVKAGKFELANGITAIAAGTSHTCALNRAGGVTCWGYNGDGELGNNAGWDASAPVPVPGLDHGVALIAPGDRHTCVLTTAGGVQCWGRNDRGQLGDGSTTPTLAPVGVTGLASGVTALAAGRSHTCALTTAGAVKCWGYNDHGQLGDGSTTQALTPVEVSGLASGVESIATGYQHSCARTTAGAVQCWGDNDNGQLGNGTTTAALTPVAVMGLASGVAAIGAGFQHSCARTTAGTVHCWGGNGNGQLGNGTTTDALTPVRVTDPAGALSAMAAGY